MEYINYIKAKTHTTFASKSEKPVISDEDEKFLSKIISEDNPRPFSPTHGGDAQIALLDGAQNIALPPDTVDEITAQDGTVTSELPLSDAGKNMSVKKAPRSTWSWLRRDSRDRNRDQKAAEQSSTADSLHDIAEGLKTDANYEDSVITDVEAKKEEEDMMVVLETLNLAAVNNRVFSISDETQDLLQKFNLVFRDLIKGVPTAYDDLESLVRNGDKQLQKTYDSLPPFLKKLIEKLPESMTKGIGPGVMAAAAEGSSKPDSNLAKAGKIAGKLLTIPSLKELVAKPSGIAAMLRSIMTFLRARFPAFFGMNVLWSLAMFVLLFVFWYCYKRGREVRIDKERELTEQEIQRLDVEWLALHPGAHLTTAPVGAPIEDVQAGAREIEMEKEKLNVATSSPVSITQAST